jgi:phosphoadenosine phosphosulfate reductase
MTISLGRLQTFYGHLESHELLHMMIKEEFKNEIALVSSFGAGSALLLALVAEVDNTVPILFLDTEKHFPETLEYVETIRKELNLKNLQILKPRHDLLENTDKEGNLWQTQPNRCCWIRKVEPLKRALDESPYKALITGRKRYQTPQRAEMETLEMNEDGRIRVNPMAFWTKERIKGEFKSRGLTEHPLVAKGYPSIGCAPCTAPVKEGQDERAGRWAHTAELPGGEQKVECGIHLEGMPSKPDWNI